VPAADASTATTVSITPPDRIIAGAATDTAIGSIDSALASDALGGWADALPKLVANTAAATKE
jgi:hypothetical protein